MLTIPKNLKTSRKTTHELILVIVLTMLSLMWVVHNSQYTEATEATEEGLHKNLQQNK